MGEFVFSKFQDFEKSLGISKESVTQDESVSIGGNVSILDETVTKNIRSVNIIDNPLYLSQISFSTNSPSSRKGSFMDLDSYADKENAPGQRTCQENQEKDPVEIRVGNAMLTLLIIFWTLFIIALFPLLYSFLKKSYSHAN